MRLDDIKDPKLRQRVLDALGAASKLKKDVARLCPRNRRIRQNHKPLLNKLESEFFCLKLVPPFESSGWRVVAQSVRFMLANGLWYKPDFMKVGDDSDSPMVAYEVKGPHSFRGGFENLKMAAHQYPWIKWVLVWKENGQWQEQVVLP